MTDTHIQMIMGIVTLCVAGLLFPFMLYFFKKNERLHEETIKKIGEHGSTLVLHEYRIFSLEEWRKYQTQGNQPPQSTNVTVN